MHETCDAWWWYLQDSNLGIKEQGQFGLEYYQFESLVHCAQLLFRESIARDCFYETKLLY